MPSELIQSERSHFPRRLMFGDPSAHYWLKRELDFWYSCIIEHEDADGVTVVYDRVQKVTVAHEDVRAYELEPGDLVFRLKVFNSIEVECAIVEACYDEQVRVNIINADFKITKKAMYQRSEIQIYLDQVKSDWSAGMQVFAYKKMELRPPMFLLFPATLRSVFCEGCCIVVEFGLDHHVLLPSTLVEPDNLKVGDFVYSYSRTDFMSEWGTDIWRSGFVVERDDDELMLQDQHGYTFSSAICIVAKLPDGHQMVDGKLERIPSAKYERDTHITQNLHVVRTDDWRDAKDKPITRGEITDVLTTDTSLSWALGDHIAWNGDAVFWWNRGEIVCERPNEVVFSKLIELAIALDANILGDDGTVYH